MWGLRSKILFPSAALRVLHEFLSSACTYSDIKMKSTLAVFLEEADLLGPESFAHVGRGSLSSSPCSPRSAVGASVEGVVLGWVLSWGALGLEDKSAAQRQWGLGAEAPGESKRQQIHVTSAFSNYLPPPAPKPHFSRSNTSPSSNYTRLHLGLEVGSWTIPFLWQL